MNNINKTLASFTVFVNNISSDRFSNIANCCKDSVSVEALNYLPGASLFSIKKPAFSSEPMSLLLIYRKKQLVSK